MTKISIIILTYNHEKFISQNLEGVFSQVVDADVELIICDDHSQDQTDSVIKNIIQNTPSNFEVKYVRQPKNIGATPNFYSALKMVTGSFVAFCEGDDYWTDPNKLQTQIDFLINNPDYSLCFHTAVNISDDVKINETLFSKVEDREYSAVEIYKHWIVHTATVMMRAEVLKSEAKKATLHEPDLQYFDTVLFLAASTLGKLHGIPKKMSAYRRHQAGLSAGKINFKRDLQHNKLDETIGKYYGGEIKKLSNWLIFSRSKINFNILMKGNRFFAALKFLPWLLRNRIFIYSWMKK
ncbi:MULTISPECIES: glycosyltransferase [unclassified Kaistella]|uniref:glycosyltransferase n=1 Tax=unclassified Kaistella TaxID=2762626 RepID=UPI0027329446|nr:MULTISPECIES: glycosyltransferase [unclassified Kaistella]MDP2454932.1 glycosyltransferase [Kaistella sp. SH11-4b]MDP2456085.1 glycosyltransferase [Kaistella sp. SH40-3]MDP2460602.1 glycosyltransferase [Kaistella sp. SH19-2b]